MRWIWLLSVMSMAGCALPKMPVTLSESSPDMATYVVDRTQPDDYPGFMLAQGNIYSCRFGIRHVASDEFSTPKAAIFGTLLRQSLPAIVSHRVELQRFDVYHNYRLRALGTSGGGMGALGALIASVGRVNEGVFTFEKLQVDMSPDTFAIPEENMVGCDGAGEGEYYASQISGGHDVVVTWMVFKVDSRDYKIRTYYQFQPDDPASGIPEAIRMSVRAVAAKVTL